MPSSQVTLRDIAAPASVHPATVSRSLSEATRHQVNRKTLAVVLAAGEALGYEPARPRGPCAPAAPASPASLSPI
ncbi:LacI family DNA-binding transcriptional regulator [Streptomyces sp. NPDC007162]|uniref:LacI family DNA-binding transcriptional regulator n=1 Tax=Streptomyces sp. NPDC007162 TaxID=3156917 RepID=UPI0033CE9DCD